MKSARPNTISLLLCLAATCAPRGAVAQTSRLAIPPWGRTMASSVRTRGFWFQVPPSLAAPIELTALEVPDEFQNGTQSVEVVRMASAPPRFAGGIQGETLFAAAGRPSGVAIPVSILLRPGDVVGVLGAAGANPPASSQAASWGSFVSSIQGQPVTLRGFLSEGDIAAGEFGDLFSSVNWPMGRVLVDHRPAVGLFPRFDCDPQSGGLPLTVRCTDRSHSTDPGGILTWAWDFDGDGVSDSTSANPSFTYSSCGVYDIALTVTDAVHGARTWIRTSAVDVGALEPAFLASTAGSIANEVRFEDTSSGGPTTWAWDFDSDGTVDSREANPAHVYPAPGRYTVRLSVANACVTRTLDREISTNGEICTGRLGPVRQFLATSGILFDVHVTAREGIKVTALSVAAAGAGVGRLDVWRADETFVGNEQQVSAWTLVSTLPQATATGAGLEWFDVPDFFLEQGSHGLRVTTPGGVLYAHHNGTNELFANGDVTLSMGAVNLSLGAAPLGPASWSGCLHYDTNPLGVYYGIGRGCPGSAGVPTLDAAPGATPRVGAGFAADIGNMPAPGLAIMIFGIDDRSWGGQPLPLDLGSMGMAGCVGYVAPETTYLLSAVGGTARWFQRIPQQASLIGTRFLNQAIVVDPGVNVLGAVMTRAAVGRVGV